MELKHLVPDAISEPEHIFSGLRSEEDEMWGPTEGEGACRYCYVSRPAVRYVADGRAREPEPDEVFLVFVSDELAVYHWAWYKADSVKRDLTVNYANRFEEQLL